MLPVIAIVGRPNVGKSTIFNMLTKTRAALVANVPGVTRDRLYGQAEFGEQSVILIDTGGLVSEQEGLTRLMAIQTTQAIEEADVLCFVLDCQAGLTHHDELLAQQLRCSGKPVLLAVNKIDGFDEAVVTAEFHSLGLGEPIAIAASHRRGVKLLTDALVDLCPAQALGAEVEAPKGIKICIVGRPNVGKSTLVNRMLGEERVVVFDLPGTTLDSLYLPFERRGEPYVLIDTAGVRRKARVSEALEKFSIIKTLQAMEDADVAIIVIDAVEGISDQDLHMIRYCLEAGRAIVIAVNKWDALPQDDREQFKAELDRRLVFVPFAKRHRISALHGTGVGDLFRLVNEAYASATASHPTPRLTELLKLAVQAHQPPMINGRRPKLLYAHMGGRRPPIIVIHGRQGARLPEHFKRYLSQYFRTALKLVGTPIRLQFKDSENPYDKK